MGTWKSFRLRQIAVVAEYRVPDWVSRFCRAGSRGFGMGAGSGYQLRGCVSFEPVGVPDPG